VDQVKLLKISVKAEPRYRINWVPDSFSLTHAGFRGNSPTFIHVISRKSDPASQLDARPDRARIALEHPRQVAPLANCMAIHGFKPAYGNTGAKYASSG
jgi:hypothetical protein